MEIVDSGSSADEVSEKETGIVRAFGMYWRRNFVRWTNNPKLLGQQSRGAESVNFSDQIGVYLLHDGRETIYVGCGVDRTIGNLLFDHTYDRLNGRWDRFSWFGLLSVTEDGKLISEPIDKDRDVLITTLEALLIEALEPPQNRKRGDEFRAVEYLQVEDPSLQKRQRAALLDELKDMLMD
ncbi:MAG: GIY-YIG nuclease family protein [Actinobacteria bacterium]|nr:GIY-YIG nuclease family protein [Actinomycetota bacterium]